MLVNMVRGANAPLVEQVVKEQIHIESQGQPHKQFIIGEEMISMEISEPDDGIEQTFALIKPDGMAPSKLDAIMDIIRRNRFEVVQKRKIWMDNTLVEKLYSDHANQPYFDSICNYLTSAPVLCLMLKKEDAIKSWREIIGPYSSIQARDSSPNSIRALHGTDSRINVVFGADDESAVTKLKNVFFDPELKTLEIDESDKSFGVQKSFVLIKPDILTNGKLDSLIDRIICKGYNVTKREELTLTPEQVRELYPSLKDDPDAVDYLSSEPVLALLVTGECCITGLLEMIGDEDPNACKLISPMSIRALFGTDLLHNAINCSQKLEDATHEITFIFPMALKTGTMSSKPELDPPTVQRTLALIKPDAYGAGKKDEILSLIEQDGFKIIKQSEIRMTLYQSREFYKEHEGKPFYETLTTWMCRYPRD